jgi:hypothetical protein
MKLSSPEFFATVSLACGPPAQRVSDWTPLQQVTFRRLVDEQAFFGDSALSKMQKYSEWAKTQRCLAVYDGYKEWCALASQGMKA